MVKNKKYTNPKNTFELKDKPLIVYKSGNSNVITIPSYLDIQPGDRILLGNIKKVNSEKNKLERDLKIIDDMAGKYNLNLGTMTAEELDIQLEGVYE